jgi:hypothetical protein
MNAMNYGCKMCRWFVAESEAVRTQHIYQMRDFRSVLTTSSVEAMRRGSRLGRKSCTICFMYHCPMNVIFRGLLTFGIPPRSMLAGPRGTGCRSWIHEVPAYGQKLAAIDLNTISPRKIGLCWGLILLAGCPMCWGLASFPYISSYCMEFSLIYFSILGVGKEILGAHVVDNDDLHFCV